jgi:AcrR family transcriptional regulator
MKDNELKEAIVICFLTLFNEYGHKATLDMVARKLKIAKKTIYKYYPSKTDIYLEALKEGSAWILSQQKAIYSDSALSTKEKLMKILTIPTPEEKLVDISRLEEFQKYEPAFYQELVKAYERQWDYFILLAEQAKKEGILKKETNVQFLVSLLTSGMKMTFKEGYYQKTSLSYTESIRLLAETVMKGAFV